MKPKPRSTHVYIAECSDGSYYTGVSANVKKRIALHNAGRGAKYTRGRRPVQLVYLENCKSLSLALKRERQIKGWKRARKEALVSGNSR
jgi:putative endonuclease